jgi:hypothetical protein
MMPIYIRAPARDGMHFSHANVHRVQCYPMGVNWLEESSKRPSEIRVSNCATRSRPAVHPDLNSNNTVSTTNQMENIKHHE